MTVLNNHDIKTLEFLAINERTEYRCGVCLRLSIRIFSYLYRVGIKLSIEYSSACLIYLWKNWKHTKNQNEIGELSTAERRLGHVVITEEYEKKPQKRQFVS